MAFIGLLKSYFEILKNPFGIPEATFFEEVLEPRKMKFRHKVVAWFKTCYDMFDFADIDFEFILFTLLLVVLAYYLMRRIRFRNIYYRYVLGIPVMEEAAIPGSTLKPIAGLPSFQISLRKRSTFYSEHIGYAVRIGERTLVTPAHVWEKFRGDPYVELMGAKQSALVAYREPRSAKFLQDLVFVNIDAKTFSYIGSTKAEFEDKTHSMMNVSIAGPKGQTAGFVKPTDTFQYMYQYNGTTLPGYSGAPYYVGSRVYGIHLWSAADGTPKNYGHDAAYVKIEFDNLVTGEASQDERYDPERNAKYVADDYVSKKDIARQKAAVELFKKAFARGNLWADEMDEESSLTTDQAHVLSQFSKLKSEEAQQLVKILQGTATVQQQDNDGEEVEVACNSVIEQVEDNMLGQVAAVIAGAMENIDERFVKMEGKLQTVQADLIPLADRLAVVEQHAALIKPMQSQVDHVKALATQAYEEVREIRKVPLKAGKTTTPKPAPRSISPTVQFTEDKSAVKMVYCPIEGCNRLFMDMSAAQQHAATAPKHQDVKMVTESIKPEFIRVINRGQRNPIMVKAESAWKSDFTSGIKVKKANDFLGHRGKSPRRRSPNLTSILTQWPGKIAFINAQRK